jgi:hypothetical protein
MFFLAMTNLPPFIYLQNEDLARLWLELF